MRDKTSKIKVKEGIMRGAKMCPCQIAAPAMAPLQRARLDGLAPVSFGLRRAKINLVECFKSQAERLPSMTKYRHTLQLPYKSWRKTARMILTTKTRPHHQRLHCSYFSIPYFLGSLLFSMEKWTKKWTGCSSVFRLMRGSISSAKKNLAEEITWITWNYLQNLEIISSLI